MSISWDIEPDDMARQLFDNYVRVVREMVYQVTLSYAPRIEAWMKKNAVWTDRTGNARQSLWSDSEKLAEEIVLVLGHGVEYGIFLETISAGKWAIITPALDYFLPKILDDIRKSL
jgi:lauroyl/myristoyl acyltransferase